MRMQKLVPLLALLLLVALPLAGQNEKKALRKASEYLEYEEYKQAIPYLREAIGFNDKNALSQYLLGLAYFKTYQKKMALQHFEAAEKLNSQVNDDLYYYLGNCLHYNHHFDRAIVAYQKALTQFNARDPRYRECKMAITHCEYAKKAVENPNGAKIVNLGQNVNSQHSEHSPVISADESVLIFTGVRPENEGCKGDPMCTLEDIFICYNHDGTWTAPEPISKQINSKNMDATIGLTPDGQSLFIYKNPPNGGDIFVSHLEGTEWTKPDNLGEPINSRGWEPSVAISPDSRMMIFTSDRDGGLGDTDLWMVKTDGSGDWSEPVNMGDKINTPFAEDSPFLHPNGRTLYFSTNGRADCLGSFDIYASTLQDDGTWGEPQNLGYPINTPDKDIYFVLSADGRHGYYASAKEGGYGDYDLYQIIMPVPKPVDPVVVERDTVIKRDTVVKTIVVENTLTILKGKVTDKKTGEPVAAEIKVIDNEKNQVIAEFKSNSATGRYLISLPSGRNYNIQVNNDEYLFRSVNVNVPKAQGYSEVEKDIELEQIEVGVAIVLPNIFYDVDKATLRQESVAELDRLHELMVDNPTLKIEIGGHTDSDGSDTYNQSLSERRAKSVVDYLVEKGIESERLVWKGYGEAKPIDTNETLEGKQNNRRTEFTILEK